MKKLFDILILAILPLFFCSVFAQDVSVYNLNSQNAYILAINGRPFDLSVSNPDVLKVSVVTDLFSTNSQLVLETFKEGISYITYRLNDKEQVAKILVDNKSVVDLIELDRPVGKLVNDWSNYTNLS